MTKRLKRFLTLFAAAALSIVLIVSLNRCGQPAGTPGIGKKVHDFRLNTLDHGRFYLNRQANRVTVLVFWATWCRACKTEMSALQTASQENNWNNVTIAAVCTDPENLDLVKTITRDLGIKYPVLLDHNAELFKKFGLKALPVTIIIGENQELLFSRTGYSSTLLGHIKSIIMNRKEKEDD